MHFRKHQLFLTIVLIIAVAVNFLSVRPVRADGETPPEPAAPTEVATEPPAETPAESTPEPIAATPEPVEATPAPVEDVLSEAPENVEVIVLDGNGESVPLASEQAAEIVQVVDPIWCPEGVLPGGPGCSVSYATISDLLNNMVSNTAFYSQNGVIYFTADPGTGNFNISPATLTGDYDTLKNHNLTLQGGWNGSLASPSLSGQTDFGSRPVIIGSSGNPWVGNILIKDITFTGASQTSLSVYTSTGNITLDNVDVNQQAGGNNTALLSSNSGNISVSNGTFDGNGTNSAGFFAGTASGSITVDDVSFTDNKKSGPANNSDGATLTALGVNLTDVSATNNDNNGITINSNAVTLNNVLASNNGTDPPGSAPNLGSGVFINGTAGSNVFIDGGTFNNNKKYGIEFANPGMTTIYVQSLPTCTGNVSGCTNGTFVDATPPTLTLPADITVPVSGSTGAVITYSVSATDNFNPSLPVSCSPPSGSTFPTGTTLVSCFATDGAGNSAVGHFNVTVVDTTAIVTPTPIPPPSTGSTPGTSNSQSNPSALIIPVTGGNVIRLDCDTAFWAFGIKLSYMSLCNYQTSLESVSPSNLPGTLPTGYSFVMGLDLRLLLDDQVVEALPSGASIQLDFPLLDGSTDEFVVLHWNGSDWVEIAQQAGGAQNFYPVMTTEATGIFVLAKK